MYYLMLNMNMNKTVDSIKMRWLKIVKHVLRYQEELHCIIIESVIEDKRLPKRRLTIRLLDKSRSKNYEKLKQMTNEKGQFWMEKRYVNQPKGWKNKYINI